MSKNIWAEKGCVWEDCDQEAIYCGGHALEYANVADENEAIRLREQVETLVKFVRGVQHLSRDHTMANKAVDVLKGLGFLV